MLYASDLAFGTRLVKRAGGLMRRNLYVGQEHRLKADGSTLTDLDLKINQQVITALRRHLPEDSILGEEQSDLRPGARRTWILDPIDGTFPFTCGVPTSVVMLALIEGNRSVLGLIYNPYTNQLFSAVRGQGAWLEDPHGKRKIEVKTSFTEISKTPVGITGSISGTILHVPDVRIALEKAGGRPQILGSTGYELAMVAAGQYGGQVFGYGTRHDMAAADVIIQEAGGMVTDVYGQPLDYNEPLLGGIATNGVLHTQLLKLVTPHIRADISVR